MYYRAPNLLILVISALGIGWMIAACGQKGPLYLPEQESEQQTTDGTGSGAVRQVAAKAGQSKPK